MAKKNSISIEFERIVSWTKDLIQILLLAIILGVICGFIMVLFNYLLIFFQITFSLLPYFLAPILAGALTSLLVKYGNLEEILGTGSPEFIREVTSSEEEKNSKRISIVFGKTFATSWTYGSGMICGREGPGLLIGANLGALLSVKLGQNKKDASFIGASACTAAILKAPISGALFCAELPYNNHIRYKSLIHSIIAAIIAYIIFCLFFGFSPLIKTNLSSISPDKVNYISLLPFLIAFGVFVGIFILFLTYFLRGLTSILRNKFKEKPGLWILPLIGGCAYGLFLFLTIPMIKVHYRLELSHPDFNFISILTENLGLNLWTFLLILLLIITIAIILSIGTMNSAGIIMPLMFLGAILGGVFGVLFYPENPELFVLLGISAALGAATNNPIASIFIIVEMTWVPLLFIPAGIATIIAYIFSGPISIIPGQKDIEQL